MRVYSAALISQYSTKSIPYGSMLVVPWRMYVVALATPIVGVSVAVVVAV